MRSVPVVMGIQVGRRECFCARCWPGGHGGAEARLTDWTPPPFSSWHLGEICLTAWAYSPCMDAGVCCILTGMHLLLLF